MASYFEHIILGNDSKRIYRMNQYGHSWENWTTSSVVNSAIYPSGMDVDPRNGTLWWASEHKPSRIVHQTNEGALIDSFYMKDIDTSRPSDDFETEGVIVLPSGELIIIDDFGNGTIYQLDEAFNILHKIENMSQFGLSSMQGGCYDFINNELLIIDNSSNDFAVYRLDLNFNVQEKISLLQNLNPGLYSPQDIAVKSDGTWLIAAYGGSSAPEKDIVYHVSQVGTTVKQLRTIALHDLPYQKNPTGITIYRPM